MTAGVPKGRCAVVPVRDGVLPAGGIESIAEAEGHAVLIGSGTQQALEATTRVATKVELCEAGAYAPGAWARFLAHVVADRAVVILPASPDGRDLAPRLAIELERPLLASAIRVTGDRIDTVTYGGRAVEQHPIWPDDDVIVTFWPGARTVVATDNVTQSPKVTELDWQGPVDVDSTGAGQRHGSDPVVQQVLPPDVSTMDLSEAPRLLGGGAGLDSADKFEQLSRVAKAIDASMGATRVITDRGWIEHDRQIGTTGVVVDPDLYLAFGISGAVQHTAGLGNPDHIISINTDGHCPMMEMADLAIVSDANATLDALERLLEGEGE
ncbi:MAG: mycofactocin-associated electron transfer flavoprotein alpha subunit [Microthrixaceae bacterium]|nr:mycofactocin-associated electron transfer flavoprotein alpha subunit [Microthrixaceae bacterium]